MIIVGTKVKHRKIEEGEFFCPKCQADTAAIWWTADVVRAVCSKCGDLLEYVTAVAATDREGTIETGIDSQ